VTSEEILAQKLALTRKLWQKHRERLQQDDRLRELLSLHQRAFQHAQEVMRQTGAEAFCARCGREGTSCCGEDMELHCDDMLLLANLLCGVSLPSKRTFPKGCFFLGEEGCLLRIRPLICRNFICPELAEFLGPEETRRLQESLEEEALALFLLGERIRSLTLKG